MGFHHECCFVRIVQVTFLSFRGVGRSPPWLLDLEAFQYLTRNELADVFANVLIATYRMYLCFS